MGRSQSTLLGTPSLGGDGLAREVQRDRSRLLRRYFLAAALPHMIQELLHRALPCPTNLTDEVVVLGTGGPTLDHP